MLWRDGVFRYRGPQNRLLNLSIVCSAGPCYFFTQVELGRGGRRSVLPSQVQCGVSETRISDCRGSGVLRSPRHKFFRSRECVRPAK